MNSTTQQDQLEIVSALAASLADRMLMERLTQGTLPLANASRHAHAGEIRVCAQAEDGRLVLSVVDDGVGFDVAAAGAEDHHGLRNMIARARGLGGHLDLRSGPGQGTRVELVVPLDASG